MEGAAGAGVGAGEQGEVVCCLVVAGQGKRVGAAVRRRLRRSGEGAASWQLELFDFADNEQLSNVDNLLMQVGACLLLLPDDMEARGHAEGKKLREMLLSYDDNSVTVTYCKKSLFKKTSSDVTAMLTKLVGVDTHETNSAEVEHPLGSSCLEPLARHTGMLHETDAFGTYSLVFGSLQTYMRLDSAAASAINLFPKPDDPSAYGSLFGILNRCKTKMGTRLLDRWLRQPLLDCAEINRRLDIVELLKDSAKVRNILTDTALKGLPDVDVAMNRLMKEKSDLNGVFRLYTFTRGLPNILSAMQELYDDADDRGDQLSYLQSKFLHPLNDLVQKFDMLQKLVEHVVDMDRLPDLVVAARHDPLLQELDSDMRSLEREARELRDMAGNSWASFTEVKLESSAQLGFYLRTTRGDDERQLRQSGGKVEILSLQKNGVHFTTARLSSISSEYLSLDVQYRKQQAAVVKSAIETVQSYLPVVEASSQLVAELDVLTSYASVAALAPNSYCRPVLYPLTSSTVGENAEALQATSPRMLKLKKARHPCVELMDCVDFIANDYDLQSEASSFQIITGPNMGGKSTYIRGLGSIVLMAQVGCFVPCESAEIALVDAILARVGAGDAGQKGVSTFMAEMLEAAVLVETATRNSLVIIDELGRGTSTVDGFGLAWGIAQYIATKIRPFCLFATHFYELTALEKSVCHVVNKHVSAYTGDDNEIVMLHNIAEGPCSESFGIHVAQMAGFPTSVICEAKRKADELEKFGVNREVDPKKVKCALDKFEVLPLETMPSSDAKNEIQAIFLH